MNNPDELAILIDIDRDLDPDLLEQLEEIADCDGLSVQQVLKRLINEFEPPGEAL